MVDALRVTVACVLVTRPHTLTAICTARLAILHVVSRCRQVQNEVATKAQQTWDTFRKERDFHRMHHQRVVQEKNRLVSEIKRLKKLYESYEPTLKETRDRYDIAMKEKMLMRLERDRIAARVTGLESQVKAFEDAAKRRDEGDKSVGSKGAGKPKKGQV